MPCSDRRTVVCTVRSPSTCRVEAVMCWFLWHLIFANHGDECWPEHLCPRRLAIESFRVYDYELMWGLTLVVYLLYHEKCKPSKGVSSPPCRQTSISSSPKHAISLADNVAFRWVGMALQTNAINVPSVLRISSPLLINWLEGEKETRECLI